MTETFCAYYNQGVCRSCDRIELQPAEQLRRKEDILRAALDFYSPLPLISSVASPSVGFRNRAKLSVTGTVQNPVVGLLGESTLDHGRELLHCPIHHPRLNELLALLPEFIRKAKLPPYRIHQRKGELKGVIAFYAPGSDQLLLRFVLRSKDCVPQLQKHLPELQSLCPGLVCVSANLQPVPHAILEGPEEIFLTPQKNIEHPLGGIPLQLAPQAFVQTNVQVATRLYQTAAEWMAESGAQKVLELFCGQGAFSFFAAQKAGEFLGIEINAEAVKTANATAARLGLSQLKFKCADATQVQEEVASFAPDLILANPPRRGLADGVRLIEKALPRHFIYSSCAVETLAKDLKVLSEFYRLKRAQIFDLFPHTGHFETLVWVERG